MPGRRIVILIYASCVGMAIHAPAHAVIARHDVADEKLVDLGQQFPAAGRVIPDGGCTLIAPTWAITAAHVARSIRPGAGKVAFEDKEYVVKRVVFHPESKSEGRRPPRVDLALLEFEKPVEGVTPAKLYREQREQNQTAFIVGYGDVGDGKSRPRRSDGRRRAVTNVIHDAGPERIFLNFDEPGDATELEGVGGPGDSGGPALVRIDDNVFIVGVSHASMGGKPGHYGLTDIYIRISSFADWIDKVIGAGRTPD